MRAVVGFGMVGFGTVGLGVAVVLLAAGMAQAADPPASPPTSWASRMPSNEAARWQAEAEQGNAEAALNLALLYDTGRGVPQSFPEAERWYRQSAEAGNAVAAFDLAALYDSGRDGTRNAAEARRWYQAAAERGLGRAAYLLGVMLETGDGGDVDVAGAADYYHRALAAGITAAQGRLARLAKAAAAPPLPPPAKPQPDPQPSQPDAAAPVDAALPPVPSKASPAATADFARAIDRFRVAGIGDDPDGQAALVSAAANGVPLAEYDLAYASEHGIGRPANPVQAYDWYRKVETAPDAPPVLKASAAVNRQRLGEQLGRSDPVAASP